MKIISIVCGALACVFLISVSSHPAEDWMDEPKVFDAVTMGDAAALARLIDHGFDVNSINPNGDTPLIAATAMGKTEVVRLLLDKGANTNVQNETGMTALMNAALDGNIALVNLLLKYGANPALKEKGGTTALVLAQRAQKQPGPHPTIEALGGGHYAEVIRALKNPKKSQTESTSTKGEPKAADYPLRRALDECPRKFEGNSNPAAEYLNMNVVAEAGGSWHEMAEKDFRAMASAAASAPLSDSRAVKAFKEAAAGHFSRDKEGGRYAEGCRIDANDWRGFGVVYLRAPCEPYVMVFEKKPHGWAYTCVTEIMYVENIK